MEVKRIALLEGTQQYFLAEKIKGDPGLKLIVNAYPPLISHTLRSLNTEDMWMVDAVLFSLDTVLKPEHPLRAPEVQYDGMEVAKTLKSQPNTRKLVRIGITEFGLLGVDPEIVSVLFDKNDPEIVNLIVRFLHAYSQHG